MKRKYDRMMVSTVVLDFNACVLAGSVTTTKIDVNEVVVEDYENGMPDNAPFESISFD